MQVFQYQTLIIGSGAAAYSAADFLCEFGNTDIAVLTEGRLMGTSRNTGSDKQTYYKLTLSGGKPDSVYDMAHALMSGGCMDGEHALIEAALSVRCFFKLVEYGVPFPCNGFGEYVGYRTDHDPCQRATSAGPLTSKYMTETLERAVIKKGVPIFDGYYVCSVLKEDGQCKGVLALHIKANKEPSFSIFYANDVIFATGGPAGLYSRSVYPESQTGAHGILFSAGTKGKNLTEWQYGIASIQFRWNLSGTYQQVLPRYFSTEQDGSNETEFLETHYPNKAELLQHIFRKGYEWPFDPRKASTGSSRIDLLVFEELQKGRKVYLDYTKNPSCMRKLSSLPSEVYTYLKNSDALLSTPLERLRRMNRPAVELYRDHGIDLTHTPLEIAVCAQHNNGGIAVDENWETCVPHLFVIGEAAGTHGVYRPGGSALNAGQTGALRAAQKIACYPKSPITPLKDWHQVDGCLQLAETLLTNQKGTSPAELRKKLGRRMDYYAAQVRTEKGMRIALAETEKDLETSDRQLIKTPHELVHAFSNIQLLTAQKIYLHAMIDYISKGGTSRGSFLIPDNTALPQNTLTSQVQEISFSENKILISWRNCHPLPNSEQWFEKVWNCYRANHHMLTQD